MFFATRFFTSMSRNLYNCPNYLQFQIKNGRIFNKNDINKFSKIAINGIAKDGLPALHWTIMSHDFETTKLLLKYGANRFVKNNKNLNAYDLIRAINDPQIKRKFGYIFYTN